MVRYTDFIIREENLSKNELTEKIIERLSIARMKAKKPSSWLLTGDSGEGKSVDALAIANIVNEYFDVDTYDMLEPMIIYTPLEFSTKYDDILHNKNLRKLRISIVDEARELVSKNTWFTFLNHVINDTYALHREIKPMTNVFVTQYVGDVDRSTRYVINWYLKCSRPLKGQGSFKIYRLWKDDTDIERPRLRKRNVKGYISFNGDNRHIKISRIKVNLPRREIFEEYKRLAHKKKSEILQIKFKIMNARIKKEMYGKRMDAIETLVDYYSSDESLLKFIGTFKNGNFILNDSFAVVHDLTNKETIEFKNRVLEKLKEKGDLELYEQ